MSVNMTAMNQYKTVDIRSAVASASPHQLISMLLDGALTALASAKGDLARKNIESRVKHLNKANSIVMALVDYLDVKKGGEVAENLFNVYDYVIRGIIDANRNQDPEKIQELINLLLEIKQGWAAMPLEIRKG